MVSRMVAYKAELNDRYWKYQKDQSPTWQHFLDRNRGPGLRPPVFRVGEAWRNVLCAPDAAKTEIDSVLALVPDPERHKWFRSMNSSQALAQSILGNLAAHGQLGSLADVQDEDGKTLCCLFNLFQGPASADDADEAAWGTGSALRVQDGAKRARLEPMPWPLL